MRLKEHRNIIIISGCIVVFLIVIFCNNLANQKLSTTFYHIETQKNVSGIRIIELSDLHLKEFGPDNQNLVDKVESLHPDIIAVVGDMTTRGETDFSIVTRLLEKLVKIAPVYYSSGNHEYIDILYNPNSSMVNEIENTGATFLDDELIEVKIGRDKVNIGAICKNSKDVTKYKSSRSMLENLTKQENFTILLSHYPEVFKSAMKDYPVDLALCGHAHGGLIRLPFTDGLFAPDQGFFPKLTSGKHELFGSTVVVSRGLGNSNILQRVNNPPEIVVVDIY